MLVTDAITPHDLVLLGLAVPVEVVAIRQATEEGCVDVEYLAATASPDMLMPMRHTLAATLTAYDEDILRALAPAVAVFLHEHGVTAPRDLAELEALQRTRKGPTPPRAVVLAATTDPAVHVGKLLLNARDALGKAGCHLSPLGHVRLTECTLGEWLESQMGGVKRTAEALTQMQAAVHAIQQRQLKMRKLQRETDDAVGRLVQLVRTYDCAMMQNFIHAKLP